MFRFYLGSALLLVLGGGVVGEMTAQEENITREKNIAQEDRPANRKTQQPAERVSSVVRLNLFQPLTEPPCSYCVDQHQKDLVRSSDVVLSWIRGAHNGGAMPLRHFISHYRVVNDTYGLFFYDPEGGYVAAYNKDYGYRFHGWRGGVMTIQSEDGTVWSALSGRAISGPRKGAQLTRTPSMVTTWGHWLMLHPESTAYDLFDGKRYVVEDLPTEMDPVAVGTIGDVDERLPRYESVLGVEGDFEIAPYSPNTTVNFSYDKFPEGSRLLSLYPHMHQRGKSMRAWVQAGSQREALSQTPPTLNVPMYDFNWQHNYIFERPIDLTPESTIYFEASFDNSASNPANPDPSATVFWGRQSWEEMAVLAAFIAVPREPRAKLDSVPIPKDNGEALTRARSLIKRFDQNGDQIIQLREVPDVFAQFGFPKFDINGDNRLSLDELIQQPRD